MSEVNTINEDMIEKCFPSMKHNTYMKGEDPAFIDSEEKAERVRKLDYFKRSGFPERFHGVNLEDLDKNQKQISESFLSRIKEKKAASLWLCGRAGTGKTCLASAIAKEMVLNGYSVKYIKSHLIVGQLKKNQITIENILYDLKTTNLVVIDEVGRYPESNWESYYLFAIMDELYNKGRSVIMISNLEKNCLGELLGNACVDRFKGIAKSYEFSGESYRGSDKELYV